MAAHLVSDVLNIFRTLQIEILENVCQPPEGVRLDSISRRPKRELRGENMKKNGERELDGTPIITQSGRCVE